MKSTHLSVLLFSTLAMVSEMCLADAMVRIYCEENDNGTKIFINNQYKGDCPIDLSVPPGQVKLHANKRVNSEYEQRFKQDFYLSDYSIKRVEINLSKPKLTAVARKARQIEAQRQEEQAAKAELRAAKAGNIKAMKAVAQRFSNGKGFLQNSEQAQFWRETAKEERAKDQFRARLKAARSGDVSAMESITRLYETGTGVEKNNHEAQRWRQKVETAKQEKVNQEIAQRKREDMERKRIKAAAKRAGIEEELSDFTFFPKSNSIFASTMGRTDLVSTINTYISYPISLIFDIVSLPTRSTEKQKIKNKLATLPSRWAKPNSMIAKAYRQQKTTNL